MFLTKKKKLFFGFLSVLLLAGVSGFLIEKEFYPTSTKSLYEIYDIPKILVNQDNFDLQSLPKKSYGKVYKLSLDDNHRLSFKDKKSNIHNLDTILNTLKLDNYIFFDVTNISYNTKNGSIIKQILDLYKKHNVYENVFIIANSKTFLEAIKSENRDIPLVYKLNGHSWVDRLSNRLSRSSISYDFIAISGKNDFEHIHKLANKYEYPIIVYDVPIGKENKLLEAGVVSLLMNENDPVEIITRKVSVLDIMDAEEKDTPIHNIYFPQTEKDFKAILKKAHNLNKKVSVSGARHTQGGHAIAKNGIVISTRNYNKILGFDKEKNIVHVQSGIIWRELQNFLDPIGKAVHIMQAENIFSLGGTMGANAHGWTVNCKPIIEDVISFRLMLANGSVLHCSRDKNRNIFNAVVGGYGVLGIILDVHLKVADNIMLKKNSVVLNYKDWHKMYKEKVLNNPKTNLALGRLDITYGNFLQEAKIKYMSEIDPIKIVKDSKLDKKLSGIMTVIKRFIFRLSENYELGRSIRWGLEKTLDKLGGKKPRNAAMGSDARILYPESHKHVDILHEFFVPYDKTTEFIDGYRTLIKKYNLNLLNVTIRQIKQDNESLLSYAQTDCYSLVDYISVPKTKEAENNLRNFTVEANDLALNLGGSFYLPYQLHATKNQVYKAYPGIIQLLGLKEMLDPYQIISNGFFEYIK